MERAELLKSVSPGIMTSTSGFNPGYNTYNIPYRREIEKKRHIYHRAKRGNNLVFVGSILF